MGRPTLIMHASGTYVRQSSPPGIKALYRQSSTCHHTAWMLEDQSSGLFGLALVSYSMYGGLAHAGKLHTRQATEIETHRHECTRPQGRIPGRSCGTADWLCLLIGAALGCWSNELYRGSRTRFIKAMSTAVRSDRSINGIESVRPSSSWRPTRITEAHCSSRYSPQGPRWP